MEIVKFPAFFHGHIIGTIIYGDNISMVFWNQICDTFYTLFLGSYY